MLRFVSVACCGCFVMSCRAMFCLQVDHYEMLFCVLSVLHPAVLCGVQFVLVVQWCVLSYFNVMLSCVVFVMLLVHSDVLCCAMLCYCVTWRAMFRPGVIRLCSGVSWHVLLCCVDLSAIFCVVAFQCADVMCYCVPSCLVVAWCVLLWFYCGLLWFAVCVMLWFVVLCSVRGLRLLSCRGCALCCVLRVPWRVPLCSPTLCMHTSCHGAARHFWQRATGSRGRGHGKGKPGNWQLKKGK